MKKLFFYFYFLQNFCIAQPLSPLHDTLVVLTVKGVYEKVLKQTKASRNCGEALLRSCSLAGMLAQVGQIEDCNGSKKEPENGAKTRALLQALRTWQVPATLIAGEDTAAQLVASVGNLPELAALFEKKSKEKAAFDQKLTEQLRAYLQQGDWAVFTAIPAAIVVQHSQLQPVRWSQQPAVEQIAPTEVSINWYRITLFAFLALFGILAYYWQERKKNAAKQQPQPEPIPVPEAVVSPTPLVPGIPLHERLAKQAASPVDQVKSVPPAKSDTPVLAKTQQQTNMPKPIAKKVFSPLTTDGFAVGEILSVTPERKPILLSIKKEKDKKIYNFIQLNVYVIECDVKECDAKYGYITYKTDIEDEDLISNIALPETFLITLDIKKSNVKYWKISEELQINKKYLGINDELKPTLHSVESIDSQTLQVPDKSISIESTVAMETYPQPVAWLYFGFPDDNGTYKPDIGRPHYSPGRTYIEMNVLPGEKTAYFTLCEDMDTSMARNLVLQWAGIAPVCYANGLSDTLLRFETTRPGLADLVNGNWVCTRKAAVRCVEA